MALRPDRWRYVVAYDVSSDARRARIERICKGYGRRVQYSVFECLLDELGRDQLERRLVELLDLDTDRLAIYHVDENRTARFGGPPEVGPPRAGRARIV